jgi:hypothetical protein
MINADLTYFDAYLNWSDFFCSMQMLIRILVAL